MGNRELRAILILIVIAATPGTLVRGQLSENSEACLACHGDPGMEGTRFSFENGSSVDIFVNAAVFGRSVHGSFDCSDCHVEFSEEDHPGRSFQNLPNYRESLTEPCTMCHSFEGLHETMLATQDRFTCVDCHGAHAVQPVPEGDSACLGCHTQGMRVVFQNDTSEILEMDRKALEESVHGKLRCVDCHFGFSSREHPERTFENRREMTLALSESCRRCHFDKYTRTLESVHFEILQQGSDRAPVCTDCHGSHSIQEGRHDKLMAARKCENCHEETYQVYANSVHGSALVSADNQDIPVCSDCHTSHKITDPTKVDFRNRIPEMCGDCHANREIMSKYGLSTAVLDSYLEDFHGVTLSFYRKEEDPVRHIAVCTDCHGIHDITSLRARETEVVKATLLERCQQCHPDATENFPDSWVSHYEPTLSRAPLVYGVHLFYNFFIPFMVVGLVLQILLHIWRYAINR